jgi:D-beta-D-heptose 7-phosphate kinase/D-beta-D-heptose 1-phosphate adenosyltransferase
MPMHELIDSVRRGFRRDGGEAPCALVVGDLMLDRYLWGEVERISPEAPVPVVRLTRQEDRVGGAGNVAANLVGLGLRTALAGFVGTDEAASALLARLQASGIEIGAIERLDEAPTITKTRVIGGHQQMLRVDRERSEGYSSAAHARLRAHLDAHLLAQPPAVIVLSDYAKGVLAASTCQALIDWARAAGVPILVDPKGKDFDKYRGATGMTPNKHEAAEVCGVSGKDTARLLDGVADLRARLDLGFVALTRGEDGISLFDAGEAPRHLPAIAKQVFDVSGAGDTVIATLAAALAAGIDRAPACRLANLAAGVVVGKVGTAPIDRTELLHEMERLDAQKQADKICTLEDARQRMHAWRQQGRKVVFTNGCFDLLHVGHVTYLEQARALGDRLLVGLNTDRSVRELKGPARPVIGEEDRARVLAALESVDAVVLFDEETPLNLIMTLRPDVLVKGSDYREDDVVGGAEVKAWGGCVRLIPVVPGRSSSGILDRVASGAAQD